MTLLMDKEAALEHFMEHHVSGKWREDLLVIDRLYAQEQVRIDAHLMDAFEAACRKAATLQKEGRKGSVQFIHFSYLRTRIQSGSSHYRIDVYDANWFLDQEECSSLWEPDFIFRPLFARMAALEDVKAAYARKITSMDIERLKQREALKYHLLALEYIRSKIPFLLERDSFRLMQRDEGLRIMAGEYMDACELIYPEPEMEA